ncbi:E2F7_8 [Acanthosepion pharaonis]|uniref:E2F7_8 n=1 Tax=Acanthosepion pharaonis TaxID=158019 RepID=A0A812ELM4_ACAPH|nr:E2F7_8 [Sepia pharaonis]
MALVLSGKRDLEDFDETLSYSKRLPLVENIHHNDTVGSADANDTNKEENKHSFSPKSPKKAHSTDNHSTNGAADYLSCLANVCETQSVTPKKKSTNEQLEASFNSSVISKHNVIERVRLCSQRHVQDKENCISPKFQSPRKRRLSAESQNTDGSCNNLSYLANVCETQSVTPKKKSMNEHFEPPLTPTANLKMLFSAALAEREGFQEQMNKIKEYERKKDLDDNFQPYPFTDKCHFDLDSEQGFSNNIPKFLEKSLGIMSQKFLMLFLVLKPKTVNLDLAAKILIGDMTVDKTENSKFKTKIRRLYDIANILTSLDLIKKVHVTEIRGRKPAFKYIGPEIDNTADINICSTDGCHRPSSRHSLLDCVKNQEIAHILNKPGKKAISRSVTSQDDMFTPNSTSSNGKKAFSRHASFDSICEVAEKERTKLFSIKPSPLSTSQPCSPTKDKNLPQWKQFFSTPKDNPQQIIWVQKGNEIHEYHVIPSPGHPLPLAAAAPMTKSDNGVHTPVSIPSLTSGHTLVATHSVPVSTVGSKVSPATTEPSPLVHGALLKQPTSNQLTPEQMKAVLKSLKDPVPVSTHSGSSLVDASTQSSPTANQETDSPSLSAISECEDNAKPVPKQNQIQEADSSNDPLTGTGENGKRQSPIRVLHLEPEFQVDKDAKADGDKTLENAPGKDDLAVPLGSELNDIEDKCFKPISAPVVTALPTHNCSCCLSKHSIRASQPGTPKLVHLTNQTSPHPVMQLPLLAVASVTASPAQVTNSFAYTNTDIMSSRGMKIHQLPSPHILTFSPVPTIGIADNSQPSQTLVAFPVSQQSAMTLASVQLVQSSCSASGQGNNVQMKTPTPLTMHNPSTTPGGQMSFQSPHSVYQGLLFLSSLSSSSQERFNNFAFSSATKEFSSLSPLSLFSLSFSFFSLFLSSLSFSPLQKTQHFNFNVK